MDTFFTSTAVVALAEIGDKTQLLAIILAARFHKPVPIIFGILAATLANHFLAALLGTQAANILQGTWFNYAVAGSFILMGAWTLIPDKLDDASAPSHRFGAFFTTLIVFFLVEMGDKTQIATIALGAKFQSVYGVTAGTTLGMMLANVPAVVFGHALIRRVPLKMMRMIAAGLFILIGVWMLLDTMDAFATNIQMLSK
jgi:putative Ca2+/H+ antiporter (TMEM165/GDT1 family)